MCNFFVTEHTDDGNLTEITNSFDLYQTNTYSTYQNALIHKFYIKHIEATLLAFTHAMYLAYQQTLWFWISDINLSYIILSYIYTI